MLVPKTMENLVRGCAEIGAKNHIVEKKNFILFIDLALKTSLHEINATKKPREITIIVNLFSIEGRTNGAGLNVRKISWKHSPATIAAVVKMVVAQFT